MEKEKVSKILIFKYFLLYDNFEYYCKLYKNNLCSIKVFIFNGFSNFSSGFDDLLVNL